MCGNQLISLGCFPAAPSLVRINLRRKRGGEGLVVKGRGGGEGGGRGGGGSWGGREWGVEVDMISPWTCRYHATRRAEINICVCRFQINVYK